VSKEIESREIKIRDRGRGIERREIERGMEVEGWMI
jgi:hypothetical protein